jgi:hypothetical protein
LSLIVLILRLLFQLFWGREGLVGGALCGHGGVG